MLNQLHTKIRSRSKVIHAKKTIQLILEILTNINTLENYFLCYIRGLIPMFLYQKCKATGHGCWRLREPNPADFVV